MNRESTRKRRVQKTLGLHYSRFYVIALCIDSRFRHKILENCSQAAPVEKVGLEPATFRHRLGAARRQRRRLGQSCDPPRTAPDFFAPWARPNCRFFGVVGFEGIAAHYIRTG